ncbi:MAG: hypothetical protein KatS3mg008_0499 [Acidimicrobiales bacterium]|nr:MAG: hypothetical protein KatS3mg008_0499 [Acidimicrobiales bacterium]
MNERWTFLVLSDADRNPTGLRILLTDRDRGLQAAMQMLPDGSEVDVSDEPHDYECMEWKAVQIIDEARGDGAGREIIDAAKRHLRSALTDS